MLIRPDGVAIDGVLERGLELVLEGSQITEIRPHTGLPDPFIVSPAFVNAHSHLEYRGFLDQIEGEEYFEWILELTEKKTGQTAEQVVADCHIAALENRNAGVALILEHTDRPGSDEAMTAVGLDGFLFHEVITAFTPEIADQILNERVARAGASKLPGAASPHAPHTVDPATLAALGASGKMISIHVHETVHERQYWEGNVGKIAERRIAQNRPHPAPGTPLIDYLDQRGLVRPGVQWVHACDVTSQEIQTLAGRGVTVAHCPRSNERLHCPTAPIREMLDAGIVVALGLDSVASSGPIDIFAEMRSAIEVSGRRGKPIFGNEVWQMATTNGAKQFGYKSAWNIEVGASVPLIAIHLAGLDSIDEVIETATPQHITWLETNG